VFGRDKNIFNTEYLRIQHIASVLKDDAYDNHREHFETITLNEENPSKWYWQTSRDVYAELNNQYETLDLSRQANIDFDCLWMKNCKVTEHLPVYSCCVSPARSLLLAGSARAREHVFA
jgi:hypothetical protein